MKRTSFLVLGLLVACSSAPSPDDGPLHGDGEIAGDVGEPGGGASGDFAGTPSAAGASSSGATDSSGAGGTGHALPGILTAGVWDDNKNFDLFLGYRAQVSATAHGLMPLTEDEHRAANALALAPASAKQTLDVSIVIDTTGSMGDEIRYLDREFDAIASAIETKFPGAEQHWSLVAYKDKHDPYVARWFDFRSNTTELHDKLTTLEASGGGDFPESPEVALDVASRLSWRTGASTAKLIFWIADAPHHDEDAATMAASVRKVRDKGIHVYPVASSGIDEMTELTMRSTAQVTGGRYVFLTDDSGVGGAHKEPSVPCYFVTKLDDAILRVVDIEMTGQYREPTASELIRTGGDPSSGYCTLESGKYAIY
jgi:hypothetical protein